MTALARQIEEHIVGVLIDHAAYLHGADPARLRHDLGRLRVRDFRDSRCRAMLGALEALAQTNTPPTVEAVAATSGIPLAHVSRIVLEVWAETLVDIRELEDSLRHVRQRIELESIANALARIAREADAPAVEAVSRAASAFVDVVRGVRLPEPCPTTPARRVRAA